VNESKGADYTRFYMSLTVAYNLLSVSKTTDVGQCITFHDNKCLIHNEKKELVVIATKVAYIYHLNCHLTTHHQIYPVWSQQQGSTESLWHRCFGHLGETSLRELAKMNIVEGLNFKISNRVDFGESRQTSQETIS
jgi:hypothetical protein